MTLPASRTSEPNSPIARANASAAPARIAGRRFGRMIAPEVVSLARAERGRRLLHVAIELDQRRLDRADDEGKGDEEQRQHHSAIRCRRCRCRSGCRCRRGRSSMMPATIVGSANGRSMTELTIALPGNSSRTSTQAIVVPMTQLITVTASDEHDGRARAPATACGSVIASQKPARPSSKDFSDEERERDQHDQAEPGRDEPRGKQGAPEARHEGRPRERYLMSSADSSACGHPEVAARSRRWSRSPDRRTRWRRSSQPPRSSIVNRPLRRRELVLVLLQHLGVDRPVAAVGEDLLALGGVQIVEERLRGLGVLAPRRRPRHRVSIWIVSSGTTYSTSSPASWARIASFS